MKLLLAALLFLQPGPRVPLTPAETLIAPDILRTIERSSVEGRAASVIDGADRSAGEIALVCAPAKCEAIEWAMKRLGPAIAAKQIPQPARSIRLVQTSGSPSAETKAAIFVAESKGRYFQVIRGAWSNASVADEVVEVFARQAVAALEMRNYESAGQPQWEARGIPVITIVPPADATDLDRASFIAAASAYFLATLPNAGSEALLSHLMVGAHARLAEDGRRAVAMMGSQQRASGEVLTMFANAIDREQRRIASFERFMPAPVDPLLHGRIADMQKDITGVWSSIGITPSPFVPPAERIRGRGGEDRRIPSRPAAAPLPKIELPTAFLKFENVDAVVYELGNFIDGKRSISDIRDAVSSEFTPIALPVVVEYFERLARAGAISLK
jgi:hypothetical protein